jgi:hypothetical protein
MRGDSDDVLTNVIVSHNALAVSMRAALRRMNRPACARSAWRVPNDFFFLSFLYCAAGARGFRACMERAPCAAEALTTPFEAAQYNVIVSAGNKEDHALCTRRNCAWCRCRAFGLRSPLVGGVALLPISANRRQK